MAGFLASRMLRGHNPLASEGEWAFIGDVSAYPLSHFILPFTMHLFFENFWLVLCCCYLYESFEAILDAEFVEKGKAAPGPLGWEGVPEPKLDSLVGDPLMSCMGLLLAKLFRSYFTNEDTRGSFPSEKGSVLRRATQFFFIAAGSFFFLNWDPSLKDRPEGWTEEVPYPPWGFRLGDMIFATNYIVQIRLVYRFQGDGTSSRLYIAWASLASFFFVGIIFLGKPLGGTTYERLVVQWLLALAVFGACFAYRIMNDVEAAKKTCPLLFPAKWLLQDRDDEQHDVHEKDQSCDVEISEKSVLSGSS
eukprot:gnl/MRDRNA2_/MRDRNA2_32731_c0_seq1.p1 gnl/MRDRNA2_/MRDRNA2_32731_c0~~gnl/MRDRNA2_/MRDRNA2_32731_c0_seq1.p1  ORF type:complete len:326 (-),score=56.05 gnl/MRDRNA2_/MRDRNA2_32731_c0_seq1:88-1002(-)